MDVLFLGIILYAVHRSSGYPMGSLLHLDFQHNHNVPDTGNDKIS
jgi:hypothetical protein